MAARTLISWSSGKDSAWTLHRLRHDPGVEVAGLLVTLTREYDRVAMHAVRRELVNMQAAATELPLWPVEIPAGCSNEAYEAAMRHAIGRMEEERIEQVAFGDLFLDDVRQYRERLFSHSRVTPVFPLWKLDTTALANEIVSSGLRAILTCVDPRAIDRSFIGREFDAQLLRSLPASADPCGERGEFHTFVYEGPMFSQPLPIRRGEAVDRDGFVFIDLLPGLAIDCAKKELAMSSTRKPSENEEEYFARMELERRKKWEEERAAQRSTEEKKKLKELHWMRCPKDGTELHTVKLQDLDVERCVTCNGTWFDAGEMEHLLEHEHPHGVLGRLKRVFS